MSTRYYMRSDDSSRLNSETNELELLENLQYSFHWYHMHIDVFSMFYFSATN